MWPSVPAVKRQTWCPPHTSVKVHGTDCLDRSGGEWAHAQATREEDGPRRKQADMVFRFGRVAKAPDAAARLADVEHEVTAAHAELAAARARIAQLTTELALLGQPPDLLTRER